MKEHGSTIMFHLLLQWQSYLLVRAEAQTQILSRKIHVCTVKASPDILFQMRVFKQKYKDVRHVVESRLRGRV